LKNFNILDLFAGAGGLSLGFHEQGFDAGVLVDNCSYSIETLKINFEHRGGLVLKKDLHTLTPATLNKELFNTRYENGFDLIIGGPPCQGWSMASRAKLKSLGRNQEHFFNDDRNKLINRYMSFISYYKPKAFLMENVKGMKSYNGFNVLERLVKMFNRRGYVVTYKIIDSSEYGIPQKRERIFIAGVRKDLNCQFEFPATTNYRGERKYPLVTLKDAIGDLPVIRDGSKVIERAYSKNKDSISDYAKKMREGVLDGKIYDHICTQHRSDDIEAFKILKQGGMYKDLPKRLKRYRDDTFSDKYKKLKWDSFSRTITAHLSKDCYSHIHPSQARTISVREAARLQSFPDKYYFHGGMCSKFKLIGNAVPPLLSSILAKELKKQVFKKIKDKNINRILQ
jgi:DNA (cytosine-5)-methyltransferase 1